MKKRQDFLTDDQAARLAPYERFYRMALDSGVCSYPGEKGLRIMQEIWLELTNTNYPFRSGCNNCIFNLVKDMGTLYRQYQEASQPVEETAQPAEAQAEVEAAKPAPKKKTTPKKKK